MKNTGLGWRLRATAMAVALLTALPALAQFTPVETEVCPASARVYDPEFNTDTQLMAYYDGRGGLRVASVLADGSIDSAQCAGTLLARNVTISIPDLPFRAGPEWAFSARGLELYYTKIDSENRVSMARARRMDDGRWRLSDLPDSTDRGLALTSADATDAEPRLIYALTTAPGAYALAWREASRPETETVVPGAVDPSVGGAPRWVPGRRALTLALPDASGVRQAVLYDVDGSNTRHLTRDSGNKDEVWLWAAPEFGGALGLMTVADGCCLRFYREDAAGQWQLYREIRTADFSRRSDNIYSPEILVLGGRSYVAMQVSTQRVAASDIWIAEVGLGGLAPLQISDASRRGVARSEPEWMVTPGGVFVYVTATEATNRFALNRLATPLQLGVGAAR
ncbi:MAG: hypothetical protein WAQ05_01765 [Rubrivivax sp.]